MRVIRKFIQWRLVVAGILVVVCFLLPSASAVAGGDTTITADLPEDIPPAVVTDLAVISRSDTSLTLTWTAPGDDDLLGTASQYNIRYSCSAINTEAKWGAATLVPNPPTPLAPGSTETFTVTGLSSGTRYYFALKTADEVPNWSALSNSPLGITSSPTPPTPEYAPEEPFTGQTSLWGKIKPNGVIFRSVTAESFDRAFTLRIQKGTTALSRQGTPLSWIGMYKVKEAPWPPWAAYTVSLIYTLQPDGATFDPPATLTYRYDPGVLPEGVNEEDLVLAYYDKSLGEWVNLECVVDTQAKTITTEISHFTPFAVLVYSKKIVPPAAFEISGLTISPSEVKVDEVVTIRVLVANTGDEPGSWVATLKINGEVEATKYVTLAAGTSKPVSFAIIKDTPGTYSVAVSGLIGSFVIKEMVVPPIAPTVPTVPPVTPINWWLIGGIIAGLIALGWGIFLVIKGARGKATG